MSDLNHAGIEISKDKLIVYKKGRYEAYSWREYSNKERGHKALERYLTDNGRKARIVMEATGVYSRDVAIFLSGNPGIEVMVLNPLQSHRFAQVILNRSKNDKVDAMALLEFAQRMEFVPFKPPLEKMYALRSIARRIASMNNQCVRQKNQKHASTSTRTTPKEVVKSAKAVIRTLDRETDNLTTAAMKLIESDADLQHKFDLLVTIPGVAMASAIQILGEVAFYGQYLNRKKLVALAGLDPVEQQSGKSKPVQRGISRRGSSNFRRALYMPALVGKRCDQNIKAFSEHLIEKGKKPKMITVAVMRKLIHAISGMFKNDEQWNSDKFYRK